VSPLGETRSIDPTSSLMVVPSALVRDDGTFVFADIRAGTYRMSVTITGSSAQQWWAESATYAGRDLLDGPAEILRDTRNVVITMSNDRSELSGVIELAEGVPASELYVLAAPFDRRLWPESERRVRVTRPDTDGRY